MNVHTLGGCVEGTDGIRRLGSIRFGDLLVGYDSNGNSRLRGELDEHPC